MTSKDKRKAIGAFFFTIIILGFFAMIYSIAQIVIASYDSEGIMGVFALIGLAFTFYVCVYLSQKAYRYIKNRVKLSRQ